MFVHFTKRCAAPLAAGLLAVSLAGCVSIESSDESSSATASAPASAPENSGSIEGSVTPSPKASEGAATATPNVPKETAGDSFQRTFDLIAAQATEKKCSRNMTLAEDGQILKLIGDCSNVEITGTGNMIISGHIESMSISGNGNILAVNNIKEVEVSGVGNSVAWRNANAAAEDTGQSNQLGENALSGIDLGL